MEEDRIDRIENKLDEQNRSVVEIREKVFNGFGATIDEIHGEVKELRRLAEKVDKINFSLVEHRLETCPFRQELGKRFEKRVYLLVAIATVFITAGTLLVNIFL